MLFLTLPAQYDRLDVSPTLGIFVMVTVIFLIVQLINFNQRAPKVPSVGSSGPLSSYLGVIRFIRDARGMLAEGYKQHKVYKVPEPQRWSVMITGTKLVEELRQAPEHLISPTAAVDDILESAHTFGFPLRHERHHVSIVHRLTKNLGVLYGDVHNEIVCAFDDLVPLQGDDWMKIKASEMIHRVVTRATNRVFVGLPKCRDPVYVDLVVRFTKDVALGALVLNLFPQFLKPLAARLLTNVTDSMEAAFTHIVPIVEERMRMADEHEDDWEDKPNDLISWILDEVTGEERNPKTVANLVRATNFGAIHTTTNSFLHALYHLAARPEYVQPLRQEVEQATERDGWTKAAISNMPKLDSFVKEAQRYNGLAAVSLIRKVMQPYTFSDGTHIPAGNFVSVPSGPTHYDERFYDHPEKFDGFRFSNMNEAGSPSTKNQLVTTGPAFLPFGHGKVACPGRFFAALEMKSILAHVLVTYDVKFENGQRPADKHYGPGCIPDPDAMMLFRKRQLV